MRYSVTTTLASGALLFAISANSATIPGIVRGIYCHPGLAVDSRLWGDYGQGYALDETVAHSGKTSLRCETPSSVHAQGAVQRFDLNQDAPRPLVVAGWARLEGVDGAPSYKCSVYLDLRLANGESWPMKIAVFDPAKKGWQYAEETYTPPAPITSGRAYVFLREKAGTAWFDDLYVGEIIDDAGTRSPNVLKAPGFERSPDGKNEHREALFKNLEALNCNAFHFYKSVSWEQMAGEGELPPIAEKDPLPEFIKASRQRGFKTWLTVGLSMPAIKDTTSPNFPIHMCVNNRWGNDYSRAVAHFTRYGVDGIGVVPDEWTFTTGRLKRAYAKHADPAVVEHYESLPGHADCPVCHERFKEAYGEPFPDISKPWGTADPVWGKLLEFRYRETASWMQRSIESAKRINPDVITDTMICVLPVCSDDRIGAGAAWDRIGANTQLDCLQTDPYILLHNYRGDSTHYYTTETTIHLTAANWPRWSGVTLEACRLRAEYRPKDPAEVYGAALSCLMHGSREFFWWHLRHVSGKSPFVDAEKATARVKAAYDVMENMEPYVLGSKIGGKVLVLYSRRSEDTWHWLARARAQSSAEATMEAQAGDDGRPLRAIKADERRGFLAHKHVIDWLLRRGYPFQTTFIEYPDPARLAAAEVVIVPFPLALTEAEANLVGRLAEQGKKVLLLSELSPLGQWGEPLPIPRLARQFGKSATSTEIPRSVAVGDGKIIFLGQDAAFNLFREVEPQRAKTERVPLADFNPGGTALLEQAVGTRYSLFTKQPEQDVEVTTADGSKGQLLLAINWDLDTKATVTLRPEHLPGNRVGTGYSIDTNAKVTAMERSVTTLTLKPQEAILLRIR